MKKEISLLHLLLGCVITYVLIFYGAPILLQQPYMFDGFGTLVPMVIFVFFWIVIFLFFIINKALHKTVLTEESSKTKQASLAFITFIISIVVIGYLYTLFERM